MKIKIFGDVIGLDVGASRTGVARLNTEARIAEPLKSIDMTKDFNKAVKGIVDEYGASAVVVGLPRGLDGQETQQTAFVRKLTVGLENGLKVPVFLIDEAGTTKQAEEQAKDEEEVDSIAAGIMLEDFASEVLRGRIENVSF